MNPVINQWNKYTPESIGVEIESISPVMKKAKNLPFVIGGNSESYKIYEVQTSPVIVENFTDVLLLGETVRRFLWTHTQGGNDTASGSAHTHIVGQFTPLTVDDLKVLQLGLMPFMSISWCKPFDKYRFRATVEGRGSNYGKFCPHGMDYADSHFTSRNTWFKDHNGRHGSISYEIRANENSPLWVYFISALMRPEIAMKLLKIHESATFRKTKDSVASGTYGSYHKTILMVIKQIIPYLKENIDNIVEHNVREDKDLAKEVLLAYLDEHTKAYDKCIAKVLNSDVGISNLFEDIDNMLKDQKRKFIKYEKRGE